MPDFQFLDLLQQGVRAWNRWRRNHPNIKPDLSRCDLRKMDCTGANFARTSFVEADLTNADLSQAKLHGASFAGANLDATFLTQCDLSTCSFKRASMVNINLANSNLTGINLAGHTLAGASMWCANLSKANLRETDCRNVEFAEANLSGTDLAASNLGNASFQRTIVEGANFKNCYVYGISAWDLVGTPKSQKDLIVTPPGDPMITVDDLEIAQFVYLVSNNKKVRNFMNAVTEKNVLILGRFTLPERKAVLDGLRERLREFDLLPIVFDFDVPADKDYTETVQTLAGMSMFVIVDVTNPKSTPLEMEATVKQFKIPYLPIIDKSADERPFAMMIDLQKNFHWVLPTFAYRTKEELFANLKIAVIDRAIHKHNQLREQKAKSEIQMLTIDDLRPARLARAAKGRAR